MYKVLIVDDDKTVRYILKRYKNWAFYGFTIENEACDGRDALKKLASPQFDLIITDIKMPGMDGIELLTEIKRLKYDIFVIMLSTYGDFEYAKQGIRLGALDYITKPVSDDVLDEALERAKELLDEKFLNEKKNKELAIQLEENLQFYSPQMREKKLISLLLAGDKEVVDEAEKMFGEISSVFEKDPFKIGMLLDNLLLKLWQEVTDSFPFLQNVEHIDIRSINKGTRCLDDIKIKFIKQVKQVLSIVMKYELHQQDSLVRKTCDYVMDHVEEGINLEKIAKEIHASKDYIGKLFKQHTGYNFNEYVTKVKMEHAKYLLKSGDYKNYEVCEKLGYSSSDYFCRLFKNYTGCTPLEFRRNLNI